MKKIIKGKWLSPYLPKISLKMKLTTLLLILSLVRIEASTYSQNTKLTLNVNNASIEKLFNKIESVSEYRFLFESNLIDLDQKVSVNVEKKKITEILEKVFKGTDIAYTINDRQIVLVKKKEQAVTSVSTTSKTIDIQEIKISGVVKDAQEMPIPGVNIIEKDTKNSVQTDFDGKFTLRVRSSNSVLVFSFIGYETLSKTVGQSTNLNIVLKDESAALNEVVVIGYGTAKKKDLTGSVVSISGEDLKKQPISNVAEALTGRMAGVQVASSEGSPDADIKIRVRGGGSLTQDASPLIIVDGFPVNSLSDISSSDIENITVLKDASSTAIYGSRGANGVIIVTTRTGKEGKIAVSFNSFFGFKKIAKTIDVLEPGDFVKWQYEYALLRDRVDSYEKYFGSWQDHDQYQGLKGNNWQKQIYGRMGETQSRDLGIRGGSDKVNFNFNYAHYDEKTIMQGSDFVRNNLSMSLRAKAGSKIDLTYTLRYSDTQINGGGTNEQNEVSAADARLRHSVGYSPVPLPGLTTDDTDEALSSYLVNPFVSVNDNQRTQTRKNFNMLGSISWKAIENLQLKSDVGLDNYYNSDYRFYGRSTYYALNRPAEENQGKPSLMISDAKNVRFRSANTANYDFRKFLGDKHRLKLLLGEEMMVYRTNEVTSEIQGFPKDFDFGTAKNLTSQGTPLVVDNFYSPDDKLLSFFGRVNYDINDRYLFTATYRMDGSSKFLGNNRWGYFPSAAAAWKINEENFLKDVSWIDALKLRFSYGQAGNNNIPAGQTVQTFESKVTTYVNDASSYWAASNTLFNPDLKWETTITQNIGLDFDLFKGRINGSVEVYNNKTKDLLINFPIPGSGYGSQYRNFGSTQNTGVEASLNLVAINKKDYGLNFSFNVGVNKNKITSLGSLENLLANTGWASTQISDDFMVNVGQSIGQMNGYVSDGRYEVSDFNYDAGTGKYTLKSGVADATEIVGTLRPGMMKLKNVDGSVDNKITTSDKKVIGNANPKHTGGMVINANAYGFDLSAAFNWSVGNDVYNANKIEFNTSNDNGQYRNLTTDMADGTRWTNLDPATGTLVTDPDALTALNANTTMWSPYMKNFVFSDWAVEDGSFLRLNMLSLGYTLPEKFVAKIGLSKLRFYATANNVFIITKYSGLDPEVSTRRKTPLTPGVDYSGFPRSRQVVLGLNLNF
ncbi:TonB-dependent receptor [Flavobacterium seoulense]|uniref:Collagen-binding protein n=1 Tax=Flavobacterium seoulense TaxID=1492738 RepID=A0A066WY68_9FLAO|nr:TonB-dependent receptor [Flavobacterium seoulense]KDN55839.1 collagen-binding protein [Flavobacterium seoulense]